MQSFLFDDVVGQLLTLVVGLAGVG
jgi:hypothetical protein